MMGEFELIRRFFFPVARGQAKTDVLLGPGDDCAIQKVEKHQELVFSIDTLVEGVHFPHHYDAEKLGWRSLAVAASDLAAMGANPVCFTLALTLPEADSAWLKAFSEGLFRASQHFDLALAGGDTTRGPLTVTLQVHGTVPAGTALRRSGANPGDLICVTGTLGDAGAALELLDVSSPTSDQASLLEHYHTPNPRLALGQSLRGFATAAIDVSDGLIADLEHLLAASGVGGSIDVDQIPLSESLRALRPDARDLAMHAGDDYELCLTIPESKLAELAQLTGEQLTVIGKVCEGAGLKLEGIAGLNTLRGYDHFGGPE